MPAALKITLTREENQTLQELEVARKVPRRTKQRATALRLNAKGLKVKAMPEPSACSANGYASQIADYLGWAESTVRQTIHRWNKSGLAGLWEARGRGKKPRWTPEDWQVLKKWLDEPRSISSRQLSRRLGRERQVVLGAETCSSHIKKNTGVGKD